MEHVILKVSQLLESTKTTDRKKGVKDLQEHLSNPEVTHILNRNKFTDSVNWNILFVNAHRCLVLEAEKWQADESKCGGSASTIATRENLKVQYASLVETVLKKANASKPIIRCDDILSACSRIFSERYLLRNFGARYVIILRDNVLPVRHYRNKITSDQWDDLFSNIITFIKDKKDDLKDWAKHDVIDLLELVVYHGCRQSHLGIQVKNKLLPLLQMEFLNLNKTTAIQEALLSLTNCACTIVAKESRTGVCHLGELILNAVIKMYDSRCEISSPRNKQVIDFLLFQVHCHHPNGVKQGNESAYACDWNTWNHHLCAMFRVVMTAVQRREKSTGHQPLPDSFWDLSVELCNQLFGNKQTVYDISLSVNETITASAPKRRKWAIGIEAIIEELQLTRKDPSSEHSILLVLQIFQKYPNLLQNQDLYQLLEILSEMQCNCRKPKIMSCICECCKQVLEVMAKRKLTSDIWLKVWETSVRSVGFNQTESHPLLRKLISLKKVPLKSLQSLLQMYQSQMIQLSNESLHSLLVLLSHFPLPESTCASGPTHLVAPWELPVGAARIGLLDWLLTSWNADIDLKLLAKVLIILVIRGKCRLELEACEARNYFGLQGTSITESFCLSDFEAGLLLPSEIPLPQYVRDHSSKNVCSNLMDSASLLKLQSLLEARCQEINQRCADDEEALTNSQTPKKPQDILKSKLEITNNVVNHICLTANVLSFMVEFGTVKTESLSGNFLYSLLLKDIECLKVLLPVVLKPDPACQGLVSDAENVCKVLTSLGALFNSNLVSSVSLLLRDISPSEIVVPVVNLFEAFPNNYDDAFLDLAFSNASGKRSLQETSTLHEVHFETLRDVDKIHILCLDVLTSYGCPDHGTELTGKQTSIIKRVLDTFMAGEIYDLTLLSTFVMIFRSLSKILKYPCLDKEKHLYSIIKLMPPLCKTWKDDAEVSLYILMILKDIFKHVPATGKKWEHLCSIALFSPFKTRKFGPIFSLQLVACYETLMKVDKSAKWARWRIASNLIQEVDIDKIPSEASRTFESDDGNVAVVEEVLYSLLSPFHEVRLAAVSCVARLLSDQHQSNLWHQTMFARLNVILLNLFMVQDESMTREEKIDQGANCTAIVLHVLCAVIARSVRCYKQALLLIFRILKVKELNLGTVKKALELLAGPMKLRSTPEFLSSLLTELLDEWLKWGYQILEFPFQLMNFSSFGEFFKYHKQIILPVVLRNKESKLLLNTICQEVQSSIANIFEECFPSIYAYCLPHLADSSNKNEMSVGVRKQFGQIISVLGEEKAKALITEKIDSILIEVTKQVWDAGHHEALLKLDPSHIQPRKPFISHDNLLLTIKFLQEPFETETELLTYLSHQKPMVIHKVLLQLREEMCHPATVDQRILSLHRYCAFSHAVAIYLEKQKLSSISDFVLSDITHTLLYLIHENQQDPVMYDVCAGSCSYLKVMLEHLLPVCAPSISHILHTIVGCLIPMSLGNDSLAEASLHVLKLLIVTHRAHLGDAISRLPPFPDDSRFEDMRHIHCELKYGANIFSLEDEIKHFLSSAGSIPSFANQNSLFDGLHFLHKQLSEKKTELSILYHDLETIRGFTKDCKKSVLHQLICTLVRLTSSANIKIQVEAARCLGELGPSDLTTLVLKPAEGCFSMIKGYSDPMKCVMALAAHLLSDYLMEQDVIVVKAASSALHKVMACRGANSVHSDKNDSDGKIESRKIAPFISKHAAELVPSLPKDSTKILSMLCQDDIWCPGDETQHKEWITRVTCALLDCLADDGSYFRDLASVCEVKISFAEEMLPVLIYLALSYSPDICHQLCNRLAQFFENHCNSVLTLTSSQTSNSSSSGVYLNRASVQCMLNVVNFVRLQKSKLGDDSISMDLNYLHVASAAQFCSAYFSSIMYLELWCNHENRATDFDGGSGAPYVDYICDAHPEDGNMLQSLLREAYKQIGDHDALYGCGSSILLNPSTRVNQYEHVGKWDKVLLNYDVKLSHSRDAKAANGLANALKRSGLLNLLNTFLESLPSDQKDNLYSSQMECMWRLGQWGTPSSPPSKDGFFEWYQYSALQAIRDGNQNSVSEFVLEGRLQVLSSLSHASLESCNNIYKPLSQLQALQEIEDIVSSENIQEIIRKWKDQSSLPYNDFYLLESVLAQRANILESLMYQQNLQRKSPEDLNYPLTQLYLDSAQLARKEGQIQIAEQWQQSLSLRSNLSVEDRRQLRLEEAQLAWSSVNGAVDVATNSVARQLLGKLLKELQSSQTESRRELKLEAQALILYGRWMAETCSENPQQIIDDYFQEALNILNQSSSQNSVHSQLDAHNCLAHFADLEYQRISTYIKSESFQNKVQCMEVLRSQAVELKQSCETADHQRTATLSYRCSTIDEEEIKRTYDEQKHYIELAMRHYLISLKIGEGVNLPVFRMVSLWLENTSHDIVNKLVSSNLDNIQTFKFVILLPQLAARIGDNMKDIFNKTLYRLLLRCASDHPHHTLPLVLALANSYKDPGVKVKPNPEPRVLGATQMVQELQKNKSVSSILMEMEKLSSALISLAYAEIPKQQLEVFNIPKDEKLRQLKTLNNAMLPIITLPVQSNAKYTNIIGIHSFEPRYWLAGGINKPKKIKCVGTDGITRILLVKGNDDLRQDAVMQQVFTIMNTLLQACKETKRRRLLIRTYKIVPLSQRCGVLEWCENTAPLQCVLPAVHSKYYPADLKGSKCRTLIENARQKSNAERLKVYKHICKNFQPAFRFFFTEKFPTPAEWFEHRLAYIHSVATNSIVGYILGLGDRHVANILIDESTAELIHIDFGIAFEQGRLLPTPETVPFRLTRDIVDGMGVSGIEGVFRRSCEKTMSVLRKNQEKILTILEVLLYDPLYAWTITPKKAARRQREPSSRASVSSVDSEGKEPLQNKNKMAERVLSRLQKKLQGTEEGAASSIEGQVNRLIQQARDPSNLSRLFVGWQAYY